MDEERVPRRRFARVLIALVALIPVIGAACAGPTRASVAPLDIPDPAILFDNGTYYLFATSTPSSGLLPLRTSKDLKTWSAPQPSVSRAPAWATSDHWWAPSITRVKDEYWLHFAAPRKIGSGHCIARAVSKRPEGPFEPSDKAVTCGHNNRGAIDPEVVRMPNGNYHLWYASTTANAIYLSRMYLNGTIGPPVKMKDADQKWEEGWVENPAPYVADGRLVMLYSAGNWKTKNYRSGISICETECTGFEVPWLASGDGAADAGPGGASIFKAADGRLWVAWHSFSGKKVGPPHPRRLHVQPLNPKKGSLVLDP